MVGVYNVNTIFLDLFLALEKAKNYISQLDDKIVGYNQPKNLPTGLLTEIKSQTGFTSFSEGRSLAQMYLYAEES